MCIYCANKLSENKHNKGLNANAILKADPTRTLTLRNRYAADMTRRFKWLKKQIQKNVVTNDSFRINSQATFI